MIEVKGIVSFDESGNTGSDLLNRDQPVFTLASLNYTDEEAKELLSVFKSQSLKEIKFKSLKDRRTHWKFVEEFLNHPLLSKERISIAVLHKEYCISVHTVDRLIEELAYRDGLDLYDQGANLGMANLLHYTMPVFCSREIWEQYKVDFVNLFRVQTPESTSKFYATVRLMIETCKDEQFKGLLHAINRTQFILADIFSSWNKYSFDPALTALFNLCDGWGKKLSGYFDVYADNSKPLQFFEEYINIFKSPDLTERVLGYDRRLFSLPLKIRNLYFKDSANNPVVQLADVISGATYHHAKSLILLGNGDNLSEIIGRSKLLSCISCAVWPHQAFTPEDMDTTGGNCGNLNEAMSYIINERRPKV